MADMKSMKLTKQQKKREDTLSTEENEFPFGLRIHLDDDSLDNLGMGEMPKVETTMILMAKVEVRHTSVGDDAEDGKSRSMSLQITDMALEPEKKKRPASEILFGSE